MATTTGSRYDHIAIQDGSNTTLHYLTDNRYPDVPNDSTKYLRGDGTWNTINISTPYVAGTGTASAVLDARGNIASGGGAVAEGLNTIAAGTSSHTEGAAIDTTMKLTTSSNGQYYVPSNVINPQIYLGRRISLTNTLSTNAPIITTVTGTTITTSPSNGLGVLDSETTVYSWGGAARGNYSHAEGYSCIANATGSHAEGTWNAANGNYSHAEGTTSVTSGQYSHAEGQNTYTIGQSSHAEGYLTQTSSTATYSHAEGRDTLTIGSHSHAEGTNSIASGADSHAEGGSNSSTNITLSGSGPTYTTTSTLQYNYLYKMIKYNNKKTFITAIDTNSKTLTVSETFGTLSSGTCSIYPYICHAYRDSSHAEGYGTTSNAFYSHAEGGSTLTLGQYSHAEGSSTIAYGSYTHAEGSGDIGVWSSSSFSGEGTTYTLLTTNKNAYEIIGKTLTINGKHALVISATTNTLTVNTSLGELTNASVSYGGGSAIGQSSHVEGGTSTTIGKNSHAEGSGTIAIGGATHAEGKETYAYGGYSHTEGYMTRTFGTYAHAEGMHSTNIKRYTLSGSSKTYTYTTSASALSVGDFLIYKDMIARVNAITGTTITLSQSFGTLDNTDAVLYLYGAFGNYSHTEGQNCVTFGDYSHAEGYQTKAIASHTHAEGYESQAHGTNSHAEGRSCITLGENAHAEGISTSAKAIASHAEGQGTIAGGQYQHASGKYNSEDLNNTYAEIVGIGTSSSARKNGRTLDWSGNEQLAGSLTLGLGTTDQTTVTAAQLKQLLNSLPVLVTINSSGKITSHTWQQLHDAYFASRLVLQLNEYSAVCGLVSECDSSPDYYYVTFISLFDSSDSKTYYTTSANGYPQFAEPQ